MERALCDLKNNKSRDFEGYVNEIFKNNVIDSDLKNSILKMLNSLRAKKLIHQFMNFANILTITKAGFKLDPKNKRGIFSVPVLRYILMRVVYNTKFQVIDTNIYNCQMGAR